MEKITPSKTNKNVMKPCGKTDCAHCLDKRFSKKTPLLKIKTPLQLIYSGSIMKHCSRAIHLIFARPIITTAIFIAPK